MTTDNAMKDFSDQSVLEAWHANAAPWTEAVRGRKIASRKLVTDTAIVTAVMQRQPRSVLDIGCGEGWLARELVRLGVDCLGIDAVPALVDSARSAGGRFQCLSYEQLADGALTATFDVAVCNFSLIGDAATEAVVASTSRLLNRDGALVIQTLHPVLACGDAPYVDGWREGSWAGIGGDFGATAPWYFRTLQSWLVLFARCGFDVRQMIEPLHPETGKPASVIFVCTIHAAG